jgi:hypothetical protein
MTLKNSVAVPHRFVRALGSEKLFCSGSYVKIHEVMLIKNNSKLSQW